MKRPDELIDLVYKVNEGYNANVPGTISASDVITLIKYLEHLEKQNEELAYLNVHYYGDIPPILQNTGNVNVCRVIQYFHIDKSIWVNKAKLKHALLEAKYEIGDSDFTWVDLVWDKLK